MPGAFKLDHLQPVEPTLFSKFYNFFTFILEANSYYPRGLIMREGIHPTPEMDLTEGFVCLGHSNWTICTLLSQFYFPNFTFFSLSYWRPILITPEG